MLKSWGCVTFRLYCLYDYCIFVKQQNFKGISIIGHKISFPGINLLPCKIKRERSPIVWTSFHYAFIFIFTNLDLLAIQSATHIEELVNLASVIYFRVIPPSKRPQRPHGNTTTLFNILSSTPSYRIHSLFILPLSVAV